MDRLDYYRQRLLQERDLVRKEIRGMEEGALDIPLRDSVSELSAYDNQPADLGSETFERSKDFSLRKNARQTLVKIETALEKIDNGKFGLCESCGRVIPEERLEAIPFAALCLECKEEMEQIPDRKIRPIEEDVILPPFGGTPEQPGGIPVAEDTLGAGFDGEDSWQAVSRYGSSEGPQDLPNNVRFPDMSINEAEDLGYVEDIDAMPYFKGKDGMIYRDYGDLDDEDKPADHSGRKRR